MKSNIHKFINIIFAVTGIAFALVCLYSTNEPKSTKEALVAIWLLAPPVYFYIEWVFLYKESDDYPLDKFQYSQKLAGNIWIGVSAILIALYFKGF